MDSFRTLVAIVAGLAFATVPAKADNNDVFNFAINLECLEVRLHSCGPALKSDSLMLQY